MSKFINDTLHVVAGTCPNPSPSKSPTIETPMINVIDIPPKGEGIEHTPTVIGTDFLEDNGFTLVFSPSKRGAYLER